LAKGPLGSSSKLFAQFFLRLAPTINVEKSRAFPVGPSKNTGIHEKMRENDMSGSSSASPTFYSGSSEQNFDLFTGSKNKFLKKPNFLRNTGTGNHKHVAGQPFIFEAGMLS
jgi:hypothetical protein